MENETELTPVVDSAPAAAIFDPRRRIRELLNIPDRDRTDAEWDELNELEIQTAPGNRSGSQPFTPYPSKPSGGFPSKNRNKGRGPRKPGTGTQGAPGKPPMPPRPNNKPRPA